MPEDAVTMAWQCKAKGTDICGKATELKQTEASKLS